MRCMAASAAFLLVLGSGAMAQQNVPDVPGSTDVPPIERKACAEHQLQGSGDMHETQGRASGENELSDKLAQSGGVICPPTGLDPDIRAPAPGGGNTPVLPPPAANEPPQLPK